MSGRPPLSVTALEDRLTPTAGALDRRFGSEGVATVRPPLYDVADLATLPGGGTLVLGRVYQGPSDPQNQDFGLVRLTPAGAIDTAFGTGGLVTVGFNIQADGLGRDTPSRVLVRPDGKVVLVGTAETDSRDVVNFQRRAAVALLNADGAPDAAFGVDGRVTFVYAGSRVISGLHTNGGGLDAAVLPDNRIVVSGGVLFEVGEVENENGEMVRQAVRQFVVSARLTADGVPDASYGGDGLAEVDVPLPARPEDLSDNYSWSAVGLDGAVVVAYAPDYVAADPPMSVPLTLARVTPGGAADVVFGSGGRVALGSLSATQPPPNLSLLADSDGRLVVVSGETTAPTPTTTVTRYLATGVIDPDYGTDGTYRTDVAATAAAYDAAGRVVVSGAGDGTVLRLTTAGTPDPTFDADGFGPPLVLPTDPVRVAVTAADRLLVAGVQTVARFLAEDSQNTAPTIDPIDDITITTPFVRDLAGFHVREYETPGRLVYRLTSSNPAVGSIGYYGLDDGTSDITAAIRFEPTGAAGNTTVTLSATDPLGGSATRSFTITTAYDGSPTLVPVSGFDDVTLPAGAAEAGPAEFRFGDAETPAAELTVTVSSDNPGLVPNDPANLVLTRGTVAEDGVTSGTGSLVVRPRPGVGGTAVITVVVADAGGRTAGRTLRVTVDGPPPANTAPTVSAVADLTVVAGAVPEPIPFTVGDAQTPAGELSVTVTADDRFGITVGGAGADRTLTFGRNTAPAGTTATFTVTVTDAGGLTATETFAVAVTPPAAPPPPAMPRVRLTAASVPAGAEPVVTVKNADGTTRFTLTPVGTVFRGGLGVAVGDVTGDGVDDIVVGAGNGGGPRVVVFDGETGQPLADYFAFDPALRGGVSVAVAGRQVAAGAGAGGGPHVRLFDADGSELASYFAFDPAFRGGVSVAAGDVTGDGVADVVVGAGVGGGPVVQIVDGADGVRRAGYFVGPEADRGGARAVVRDLKADGSAEVVARAAGATRAFAPLTGDDLSSAFTADELAGVFVD